MGNLDMGGTRRGIRLVQARSSACWRRSIVLVFAASGVLFLTNLIRSGQPISDESGRKDHLAERISNQFKEVFGQTKLLKWSIPGLAHFFTMWGFFVLASVYLEAYGVLFNPKFHIPFIGRWDALGFLQDFFAVAVLLGIIVFAIIRLRSEPKEYGRASRFYGSHTGGAWLILFMIFNVIWTYALFRGAAVADRATCPTAGAHSSRTRWARCCTRWAHTPTRSSRRSRCCCTSA